MARLFLAVWPSDDVVDELRSLPRKDIAGVRFVPPERWHVTLRFIGEADADRAVALMDQAVTAAPLPGAPGAYLGPAVDVLSERALVVPAQGLDALAEAVSRATERAGDPPTRRRFVGHLTVARIKRRGSSPFRMPPALGHPVHADLDVHDVALVESTLRSEGPTYRTIATWPVG